MTSDSLNAQQIMMLRLLKNPMPEDDFVQIRRLAVKLLAKQIDEAVEEWEIKNNVTAETYDEMSRMHFRSHPKS